MGAQILCHISGLLFIHHSKIYFLLGTSTVMFMVLEIAHSPHKILTCDVSTSTVLLLILFGIPVLKKWTAQFQARKREHGVERYLLITNSLKAGICFIGV